MGAYQQATEQYGGGELAEEQAAMAVAAVVKQRVIITQYDSDGNVLVKRNGKLVPVKTGALADYAEEFGLDALAQLARKAGVATGER